MKLLIETYEQYKHFDSLLSDRDFLPNTLLGKIMFDLWKAVKAAAITEKESTHDTT